MSEPGDRVCDRVTVDEVEALLVKLPGVLSVRIVVNDWGAIEEVHVLATLERNPKQIVRDIESSLAARWGMNVDHKKVSIAQITGPTSTAAVSRIEVTSVDVTADISRGVTEVTVSLTLPSNGLCAAGSITGPHAHPHVNRLAAAATADAVNGLLDPRFSLAVDDIHTISGAVGDVMVVLGTLVLPGGVEQSVAEAELIGDDPIDAAVCAVLKCVQHRTNEVLFRKQRDAAPSPPETVASERTC